MRRDRDVFRVIYGGNLFIVIAFRTYTRKKARRVLKLILAEADDICIIFAVAEGAGRNT